MSATVECVACMGDGALYGENDSDSQTCDVCGGAGELTTEDLLELPLPALVDLLLAKSIDAAIFEGVVLHQACVREDDPTGFYALTWCRVPLALRQAIEARIDAHFDSPAAPIAAE